MINSAAILVVCLVILIHAYIVVLEMFLWEAPRTRATFGTSLEFAHDTKTLAANQGLYNGFLAAGLIWGLSRGLEAGRPDLFFFLSCVAVAGIYGARTVSPRILLVQTVPAAVGLLLLAVR